MRGILLMLSRNSTKHGDLGHGEPVRTRLFWLILAIASSAVLLSQQGHSQTRNQTQAPAALTGQVASTEEGPMEGVLVTAKRTGSTIAITVATDEQGRYRFPSGRLEPGHYAIRIRAVG